MNDISVYDNIFGDEVRERIWQFLSEPGWRHGAYSGDKDTMPKYYYKHFAGFNKSGLENIDLSSIPKTLHDHSPLLSELWSILQTRTLRGQILSRCYANAMPLGIGGGVHLDSTIREHLTAIYYPQPAWSANDGGETLFFNRSSSEIIKAVAPKPDRLVVFSGTIPHVARPIYSGSEKSRITLMFKTFGRAESKTKPALPRSRR